MKYMTKVWYETSQKTDYHVLLKASKQAETFSEEYFKWLYEKKEAAWIKDQKEAAEVSFEDLYPEEFCVKNLAEYGFSPDKIEAAKKGYFEMREQILQNYDEICHEFDPVQEKKIFRRMMHNNIKNLKANLPDEILRKVADIRVLALNYASADIKKEITAFCRANDRTVDEASKAYLKECRKAFKKGNIPVFENASFHDCRIVSCRKKGADLVLTLDNSGGFTNISQIKFKDCMVIKQDKPLHNAVWLYDEIYKTDTGYEFHVLLEKGGRIDFIVRATDIECR